MYTKQQRIRTALVETYFFICWKMRIHVYLIPAMKNYHETFSRTTEVNDFVKSADLTSHPQRHRKNYSQKQ